MAFTQHKIWWLVGIIAAVEISCSFQATENVICYYGNWGYYRYGSGRVNVEDLDPFLCTHLIYSFAGIDYNTGLIRALDPALDEDLPAGKGGYRRFTNLRQQNPKLKTMLAVGGWNEGTYKFSTMAASASGRQNFIASALQHVQKYGFDGLDYDWEFPNSPTDKINFALLIQETRLEFNKHGLLLSAAVHPVKSVIDGSYDIPVLANNLDFINVMCYDYHGSWESETAHHAALYVRAAETGVNIYNNINFTIHYYINGGATASKLAIGVGTYGRSFTLANANNNGFHAPAIGPGNSGPYTQEQGFLGYIELCESNKQSPWTFVEDPEGGAPYAYRGNQWIGYDSVDSIKAKMEYAKSMGLFGGMVWSVETDDVHASCGSTKFPLVKVLRDSLLAGAAPPTQGPPTQAPPTEAPPTEAPPTEAPPTQAPPTQDTGTCNSSGYARDQSDCRRFYQCDTSGSIVSKTGFYCEDGLVFDLTINACNWKENVPECS